MLHTVNKSPFDRNTFQTCVKFVGRGGAVLLIEDGVYAAVRGTSIESDVRQAMTQMSIYALVPDLEARGMQNRVMDGVRLVDYAGFVDLVVEHNAVQSWL